MVIIVILYSAVYEEYKRYFFYAFLSLFLSPSFYIFLFRSVSMLIGLHYSCITKSHYAFRDKEAFARVYSFRRLCRLKDNISIQQNQHKYTNTQTHVIILLLFIRGRGIISDKIKKNKSNGKCVYADVD
jgi:hypothetical protein